MDEDIFGSIRVGKQSMDALFDSSDCCMPVKLEGKVQMEMLRK